MPQSKTAAKVMRILSPSRQNTEPILPQKPSQKAIQDEQLIWHALKKDSSKGMELVFRRYYQPLCSHAVRFVGSKEVAQDIVSDLLAHFYDQKLYLTITSSIRSYLFKAVRNRGFNYLKFDLARKGDLASSPEPRIAETYQPDSITQYEELYQDFEKAIETLPSQRRKIYLLFQFEGKSMKEIAMGMELSVRTVETQLYRSKIAIRHLLKDKWLIFTLVFAHLL